MCSDNNINAAASESLDGLLRLLFRAEAREHTGLNGKSLKAFQQRLIVLIGKNCCRHKNGALLAVRHALESASERHLGFSETDITAEQSVHRVLLLHIALYLVHTSELIRRLIKLKPALKIVLHIYIRRKSVSLYLHPL